MTYKRNGVIILVQEVVVEGDINLGQFLKQKGLLNLVVKQNGSCKTLKY